MEDREGGGGGSRAQGDGRPQPSHIHNKSISEHAITLLHLAATQHRRRPDQWLASPFRNSTTQNIRAIAGLFNYKSHTFQFVKAPDGLFCAGHTVTHDGRVIVVGGHQVRRTALCAQTCGPQQHH